MTRPGRLAAALALAAVSVGLPFARIPAAPAHPAPAVSFSAMGSLGGTETVTVKVSRDTPDNWYQMDACLTALNLPQQEAQLSALLHTVRIGAS